MPGVHQKPYYQAAGFLKHAQPSNWQQSLKNYKKILLKNIKKYETQKLTLHKEEKQQQQQQQQKQ